MNIKSLSNGLALITKTVNCSSSFVNKIVLTRLDPKLTFKLRTLVKK